jgi:hypothetical protein
VPLSDVIKSVADYSPLCFSALKTLTPEHRVDFDVVPVSAASGAGGEGLPLAAVLPMSTAHGASEALRVVQVSAAGGASEAAAIVPVSAAGGASEASAIVPVSAAGGASEALLVVPVTGAGGDDGGSSGVSPKASEAVDNDEDDFVMLDASDLMLPLNMIPSADY